MAWVPENGDFFLKYKHQINSFGGAKAPVEGRYKERPSSGGASRIDWKSEKARDASSVL